MNDPLQHIRQAMLVSGAASALLGGLLLLLTVRRPWLRRMLDAEGAFWGRWGLTGNWARPLRRFEESKALVLLVSGLLIFHLALLAFTAGAYAYYAPRLQKKPPVAVPAQTPPPNHL